MDKILTQRFIERKFMTEKNRIFRKNLMDICGLCSGYPDDGNNTISFHCEFKISNQAFEDMNILDLKSLIIRGIKQLRLDTNDKMLDAIIKIETYKA